MSYSFDRQVNKWDTLPDVFDEMLDELNSLNDDEEDFISVDDFDEMEIL